MPPATGFARDGHKGVFLSTTFNIKNDFYPVRGSRGWFLVGLGSWGDRGLAGKAAVGLGSRGWGIFGWWGFRRSRW